MFRYHNKAKHGEAVKNRKSTPIQMPRRQSADTAMSLYQRAVNGSIMGLSIEDMVIYLGTKDPSLVIQRFFISTSWTRISLKAYSEVRELVNNLRNSSVPLASKLIFSNGLRRRV